MLKSDYGCEGEEVILGRAVHRRATAASLSAALPRRWMVQRHFQARRDHHEAHDRQPWRLSWWAAARRPLRPPVRRGHRRRGGVGRRGAPAVSEPPNARNGRPAAERHRVLLRAFFDKDHVVGARWWNESFQAFTGEAAAVSCRGARAGWPWPGGGGIGAAVVGAFECDWRPRPRPDHGPRYTRVLQRREGWDVGERQAPRGAARPVRDVTPEGRPPAPHLARLARHLAPRSRAAALCRPHAVPVAGRADPPATGCSAIRPVLPARAEPAHERGEALRQSPPAPDAPRDWPWSGPARPESVTLAAALAAALRPGVHLRQLAAPAGGGPRAQHPGRGGLLPPAVPGGPTSSGPPTPLRCSCWIGAPQPLPRRPQSLRQPLRGEPPLGRPAAALGIKRLLYVRPTGASCRSWTT